MDELGAVILFHRKRAGLSRADLCRLAGIGKTTLYDTEHGKTAVRMDGVLRILRVLNIRLEWSSPLEESYEASTRPRS
jgi:HTH-type transcriptional regulator/antitoxin HipB